jgi:colanic acid/amylovoran biosynthesis glycosyltransferase
MAKSSKTVVLFSINYPYSSLEHSFLKDELKYLSENFSKVYIVPQEIKGTKNEFSDKIVLDTSLADTLTYPSFRQKLKAIFSLSFFKEILQIKFNKNKLNNAVATRLSGIVTADWLNRFLKDKDTSQTILYSFWFNFTTLGFALTKSKNKELKIISRCHNFDLYGNEQNHFYVPYQEFVLNSLDAIFPDSQLGEDFIKEKFPKARCSVSLMGVSPAPMDNIASSDGIFRIVSCSYVIPRKRVHLILESLIYFAEKYPDQKIKWTHVGEGPDWIPLKNSAVEVPSNFEIEFTGNLSNEDLHLFYQKNSVDLFVNTSTKEGTPVSIIEAISYGIPILATAFGGNQEVVEKGAGVLLSPDPTKEEIATKIKELAESGDLSTYRDNSKMVWENYYNSERNYKEFCERLINF